MHLLFLCSQNKRRSLTAEKLFDGYDSQYSDVVADKNVVCLNIPDDYNYMDDDLCELLESVVPEYLSCIYEKKGINGNDTN